MTRITRMTLLFSRCNAWFRRTLGFSIRSDGILAAWCNRNFRFPTRREQFRRNPRRILKMQKESRDRGQIHVPKELLWSLELGAWSLPAGGLQEVQQVRQFLAGELFVQAGRHDADCSGTHLG